LCLAITNAILVCSCCISWYLPVHTEITAWTRTPLHTSKLVTYFNLQTLLDTYRNSLDTQSILHSWIVEARVPLVFSSTSTLITCHTGAAKSKRVADHCSNYKRLPQSKSSYQLRICSTQTFHAGKPPAPPQVKTQHTIRKSAHSYSTRTLGPRRHPRSGTSVHMALPGCTTQLSASITSRHVKDEGCAAELRYDALDWTDSDVMEGKQFARSA
jgi:hypothetical protein